LLLSRIDNVTLARALVDAGERVAAQIFANVSERRALLLQDELELGGDVTDEEVEAARNEVMAVVWKLYEHGDIVTYFGSISRAGDEGDDDVEEDEEDEGDEDEYETDGEQEPAPSVQSAGAEHCCSHGPGTDWHGRRAGQCGPFPAARYRQAC